MGYSSYPDRAGLDRHPHDDQVWLCGVGHLAEPRDGVDAVVSLCRLGVDDVPGPMVRSGNHVEVWLVDDVAADKNPNLDFVLNDAAGAVAALRSEGKTVLIHFVQAQSRTPTAAAVYGARLTGRTGRQSVSDIQAVLPDAHPNSAMLAALGRLS